ncbi:hypothetical protein R1sor_021803 [Riccia sorocarpa]|uniref:Endonuclease/exonuclease/phosphatase domain-containing protein n=1 Tax=Riccia sorocarpa TaxID=122646 RepID=A0ABD3GL17_9MARC
MRSKGSGWKVKGDDRFQYKQIKEERLEFWMGMDVGDRRGRIVMSVVLTRQEEKGNSEMKDWGNSGVSGTGRLAWAKIKNGEGEFGVVSIHAPNGRRRRMEFWIQLEELIGEGKWFVVSDFNNEEIPEDSRGKSAILHGREARIWRSMVSSSGLVDGYFAAANLSGPRFTRFTRRGSRYDFARLDRLYITGGAHWVDHIREVSHVGTRSLSDHIPIWLEVQLQEEENMKRESYFIMNAQK